jgi:hypothetical protein
MIPSLPRGRSTRAIVIILVLFFFVFVDEHDDAVDRIMRMRMRME